MFSCLCFHSLSLLSLSPSLSLPSLSLPSLCGTRSNIKCLGPLEGGRDAGQEGWGEGGGWKEERAGKKEGGRTEERESMREEGGWDGGGHRGLPGNYLLEVIGVYLGIICWGS